MPGRMLGYAAILGIALMLLSACAAVPTAGRGEYRQPRDTAGGNGGGGGY